MSVNSRELFQRSCQVVPGGVHSPVRSFSGLHTTPCFIQSAQGARFWDVEGREYLDFCMSFGPLILGHSNPAVKEQMEKALERGWSYGACEPYSLNLVNFILDRLSFVEQIRLVNSGTEAVMTALRLARAVSGREKIIKFNGCYHGHGDSMLIKAGSGLADVPEASSQGIAQGVAKDTIVLELNDTQALEQAFERYSGQIAAVIIEPLPANNGLVILSQDFLSFLRKITQQHGSLLIFDEVISGFRMAFGGMVEKTGIVADIVTYGKIIGGGMPVGAIAGKREIMEYLAPVGGVYQAGTLSANPLAMVAGKATLQQLTAKTYDTLERRTQEIAGLFRRWLAEQTGVLSGGEVISTSSLFWMTTNRQEERAKFFYQLFKSLLQRGIYLAPNACEVGFISLAHDEQVLKELDERLWN